MINQVTRDRINSLSEEYRKLAVKYKEAIKELTISELPEMVYNSNAIENSTLTLEDTEDILIRNQIRTDHEIREIYEAKNLASAIEYLMDNPEKEISVELPNRILPDMEPRLPLRNCPECWMARLRCWMDRSCF